jgi:hypothetical protein
MLRTNKHNLLIVVICLQINFIFSQTTKFGIPIKDKEIELPNKYCYLNVIELEILKKGKSKGFYNSNNEDFYSDDFKNVSRSKVIWNKKNGDNNLYQTVIPPLKPNRFYRLKASFYESESIVGLFLMMHDEKNTNWYTVENGWMKLLKRLSEKNDPYSISYDPTVSELYEFKSLIKNLDISVLDIKEVDYISGITKEEEINKKKEELKSKKAEVLKKLKKDAKSVFMVLNFKENLDKLKDDEFIKYCKWIKSESQFDKTETTKFSGELLSSPDYVNIFKFYEKYLLGKFNDKSIGQGKLLEVINEAIDTDKNSYKDGDLIPGYLTNFKVVVQQKTLTASTFSSSFESSYKLSLVPDFGYVAYLSDSESTPSGGNLFVGVNISLSPSNKDVPMQISKLSAFQRMAIHTGVTIGSIKKENVRDNFFGNYSLLLGASYKVFTQGTRVNIGGMFYNKLDAIDGSKSIAIQPYIGISIDLEIKKWLQGIFPNIKI